MTEDERIERIIRLTRGLALCSQCHIFSTGMYLNGEPVCSACWPRTGTGGGHLGIEDPEEGP